LVAFTHRKPTLTTIHGACSPNPSVGSIRLHPVSTSRVSMKAADAIRQQETRSGAVPAGPASKVRPKTRRVRPAEAKMSRPRRLMVTILGQHQERRRGGGRELSPNSTSLTHRAGS